MQKIHLLRKPKQSQRCVLKGVKGWFSSGVYLVTFCFVMLFAVTHAQAAENRIITFADFANIKTDGLFILDIRNDDVCQKASLPGARCLSVKDFLAPHRRLPNFDGALWFLGTIGLTGNEHVLIVGDRGQDKEFAAGFLYVVGQRRISVMASQLSDFKEGPFEPGETRSRTRERIFQVPMRGEALILRSELADKIRGNTPLTIIDVRSEHEYWGKKLRNIRGGHISGAIRISLPLKIETKIGTDLVVYGQGTYEGLAALARLVANGLRPKVLLEGWAGWALDGSLPVDVATYADTNNISAEREKLSPARGPSKLRLLVIGAVIAAGAFGAGYFSKWLVTGNRS